MLKKKKKKIFFRKKEFFLSFFGLLVWIYIWRVYTMINVSKNLSQGNKLLAASESH